MIKAPVIDRAKSTARTAGKTAPIPAMTLYWSSRSPFVRKVMVVAHELGLAGQIGRVRTIVAPVTPNAEVMASNPLNKLPTLMIDGCALYDSRVICEYLDGLHDGAKLIPAEGAARLTALRRQALADGMLDFLVQWVAERNRAKELRSAPLIAAFRLKLETSLDALEREAGDLSGAPFGIGHIAIGCALSYTDFRFADESWRAGRATLAAWHAEFARRASVTATEHADVY